MNSWVFESERLGARRWDANDAAAAFAIYSDPRVTRYIGDGSPRATLEAQRESLARTIARCEALGGTMGAFALVEKATGALLGMVALQPLPGSPELEVGWHLAHAAWGKGYATEAGRAALAYAREALGATRVLAVVQPPNEASLKVARRLGMAHEGRTDRFYGRSLELFSIELAPGRTARELGAPGSP